MKLHQPWANFTSVALGAVISHCATMNRKEAISWDEQNLAANAEEAENAQRMKILEPKTPFHTLGEDGETPNAFPPKAPPARAGPRELPPFVTPVNSSMDLVQMETTTDSSPASRMLAPGMDLGALAQLAEQRREEEPEEEDEVEKKRKFEENRKAHYKTGGLAALRAQAAALDDEDDDDDD